MTVNKLCSLPTNSVQAAVRDESNLTIYVLKQRDHKDRLVSNVPVYFYQIKLTPLEDLGNRFHSQTHASQTGVSISTTRSDVVQGAIVMH